MVNSYGLQIHGKCEEKLNSKITLGGRNYSLDLLRIIAIMMVLVLHTNLFGGFLQNSKNDSYSFFINLYEHLSIIAVDVFVIISAWFLRFKSASFSKVLNLIWTLVFWTVIMSLVAVMLGEQITWRDIMKLIPIIGKNCDFCSGYIVMYLFSPFVNRMLDAMSSIQIARMAISAFVLFSLFSPLTSSGYMGIGGGYSFTWFIILYIITAWIKSVNQLPSKSFLLAIYLLGSVVGAVSDTFNVPVLGSLAYNNPLVVVCAFSLFLFFVKIEIRNNILVSFIRFFAPLSFGVFLIHANLVFER